MANESEKMPEVTRVPFRPDPVTRPDIDATVRLVRTIRDACAAYLAAVDPPMESAGSPGIGDEDREERPEDADLPGRNPR